MEIKIENQFCVKRFKPGHSRVARCHKPISILCQERFKPGHSRVARCHKSIFILCQARFKPGHSRVARCHKPIFILCQARFKPGHSRVARCHKPISILCQDFQSKFLNKIIQIIYQVLGMNYYAHARPLTQKGAAPYILYDQDKLNN